MRKSVLYLNSNSRLKHTKEVILVETNGRFTAIKPESISHIVCFSNTPINRNLLSFLSYHKIPIFFLTYGGKPIGKFIPYTEIIKQKSNKLLDFVNYLFQSEIESQAFQQNTEIESKIMDKYHAVAERFCRTLQNKKIIKNIEDFNQYGDLNTEGKIKVEKQFIKWLSKTSFDKELDKLTSNAEKIRQIVINFRKKIENDIL